MARPVFYTLDQYNIAHPCFCAITWAMHLQDRYRVDLTAHDGYSVSTVFLGMDHNWGDGDPLLFETLVFLACGETEKMDRYSTWAQAKAGHERIVSMMEFEMREANAKSDGVIARVKHAITTGAE
jgi:hypothetical protein